MKLHQSFVCSWVFPLLATAMAAGCGSSGSSGNAPVTDQPYETCYAGDYCAQGLTCAATTLSASSGATGYFCTSGCNSDGDCLQLLTNYNAFCVSGQCYLNCPTGNNTCPYDQACLNFSTTAGPISLCAP